MVNRRTSIVLFAAGLVFYTSLASVSFAADDEHSVITDSGRVPAPAIPLGQGEKCVDDTDFMRRNHMSLLNHQRDLTVHEGIRKKQYSLKECISCHVVSGPDARPVTVSSPQHFCRSCHDYAAVSIDCFQCHASRPEPGDSTAQHQFGSTFPTAATVNGTE
jgi:predicted CXXCH cytochrome family protein